MPNRWMALLLVIAVLVPAGALAAQSGERSPYDLDPKCRERDAKPEDCVINDGPPQQ